QLESLFRKERGLRLPVFSAYIAVDRDSRFGIYELLAMFPRESVEFRSQARQLFARGGPRNPVIISELFKMAGAEKSLEIRKGAMAALGVYPRFNEAKRTGLCIEIIKSAPSLELKCLGIDLYSRHAPKTAEARSVLLQLLKTASYKELRAVVKAVMRLGRRGERWVFNEALRTPGLLSFECAYQWLLINKDVKKERRSDWTKQLVLGMKTGAELKDWQRVSLGLQIMALQAWSEEALAPIARRYVKDPRERYRRWAYQFFAKNPSRYHQELLVGLKDAHRDTKREVALSFMAVTEPEKKLLKALELFLADSEMGLETATALVQIGKGTIRRKARRRLELALGQADFRALHLFQLLKEKASGSVADLAKGLSQADPRYRSELADTLAYCKGTEVRTLLELLFKDPVSRVRGSAIQALVTQSNFKKNPSLEKSLLALLKSPELPIQKASIWALGKIGSTKSKLRLFDFQRSANSELRSLSAAAVATLGKDCFAPLASALSERKTRAWGGFVIRQLESRWAGDLVLYFKDHPFVVRRAICQALGDGTAEIYPVLLPLLRKDNSAAKLAWEIFGEQGEDAIDCLIAEVASGHEVALESAARALKIIGPASVPPLLEMMRAENVKLRRSGVRALGIVGSVNARVGTAVLAALEDKDLRVRAEAAGGLGSCVLPEQRSLIVSGLVRALNDSSRKIRVRAVMSFGRLGAVVADIAVPELKKTLKSWDKDIRRESLRALASMGTKRFACLPEIIDALKDKDASVRRAAIETLSQFGKEGKAALKELEKVATIDRDVPARLAAAQAIESIKEAILESQLEKK
ncbi:MAG: HEAT repeat domain-containing protein, partial [Planctomycetota bacterium]|nr:HEAT repeat domain-containing protein [Planctomycetota bacterium]